MTSKANTIQEKHIGLVLIGDELLTGARQDKHQAKVIELLKARGLKLAWMRMVRDEEALLVETFKQTFNTDEIVFSFGGIGATPDDITRECAAKANNIKIERHPEAQALIENQFGEEAYPNRILMADFPKGANIIPNPINNIAGFSLQDHHFVPGFPTMAWPMIEWVLDTHYSNYFNNNAEIEWRWDITDTPESELIGMMKELLEHFPSTQISSLPNTKNRSRLIDFGIKGKEKDIEDAAKWFENHLTERNVPFSFREKLQ